VLFRDVELQPGDHTGRLADLGLTVISRVRKSRRPGSAARRGPSCVCKLTQPCAALEGDRCRIYDDRPRRCRDFDCALLKAVGADDLAVESALQVIESARAKAEKVRRLLRHLGDLDERLPLSRRFQRTHRRLEHRPLDAVTAGFLGELGLAVHDLNLLLRRQFYPGDRQGPARR
jgi:Fe-S-cluster containining protein